MREKGMKGGREEGTEGQRRKEPREGEKREERTEGRRRKKHVSVSFLSL
jgi:hypothetical protein